MESKSNDFFVADLAAIEDGAAKVCVKAPSDVDETAIVNNCVGALCGIGLCRVVAYKRAAR